MSVRYVCERLVSVRCVSISPHRGDRTYNYGCQNFESPENLHKFPPESPKL